MVRPGRQKARKTLFISEFVEIGLEKKLENPLMNVYGAAILGSKTFIRESLGRLKHGILQKGEIAHRRELQAAHTSEAIIAAICSTLKVSREDLLLGRLAR